jgi:lipopolysaccharide transport system permease protein
MKFVPMIMFMRNREKLYLSYRQSLRLTTANLKSRYRKTWSGFLWVVLNPILIYGAQSYAFSIILKLNIAHYSLFLLSGLLPWIFISQSLEMSAGIFVNSGRLLKSFPIHPVVCLVAQIMDNAINFIAAFLLVLVFLLIHPVENWSRLLLLPIPIIFLVFGVFSAAWLLATLQVFFRDTRFIISFVLSIGFFLTPIFYPQFLVPEKYQWIVTLNPVHHFLAPFRALFGDYGGASFVPACRNAGITALIIFLTAFLFWRKNRNAIYFYL